MPDAAAPASPITPAEELELTTSYRTHYGALLAHARTSLGSDLEHFSGRIAQQAMLSTWARRAEFSSPDGFMAALLEAVNGEAATQRRKHAALHQHEGSAKRTPHVATLTTDEAVAELVATLHAQPVDHGSAVSEAHAASKHHAAEHVQQVGRRRSWKGPAALMVVIGIAIVVSMKLLAAAGAESAVKKALAASDTRTLSASRGQRGNVELADGTQASIGAESKVKLPNAFGTKLRTAEVEGSVSFDVAAGQELPFTIWAGNAIVTATGTRFAVRAFADENTVVVRVENGSVSVRVKEAREETTLAAGQAARITPDGKVAMIDGAASDAAFAWVRDSLAFTNMPVSAVLKEVSRWMGFSTSLADSSLGSRAVTLRLGLESRRAAIAVLAKAANFTSEIDKEDNVVFSAAPGGLPAPNRK
jgi:ferric-dicitrate binding protein FerR (iron transport regulator)